MYITPSKLKLFWPYLENSSLSSINFEVGNKWYWDKENIGFFGQMSNLFLIYL